MSNSNKAQSIYPLKACAFHPNQHIFNFCTNSECLLPLCPTCIDLHTQEHKNQKTYGKFQNLSHLVQEIIKKFDSDLSKLAGFRDQIDEQLETKSTDEGIVRRKVRQARQKVIDLVQRFFDDFEKQVQKSVKEFNASMKQNYRNMNTQISAMENQINSKINSLSSDKILKTVIAYYAKEEQKKIQNNLQVFGETLEMCGCKRVSLISQNSSINKMINQLSKYMYLSFENWENQLAYKANQFVKTGFSNRTNYSNENKENKGIPQAMYIRKDTRI